MKVLLVTPPFTQLNTSYPATMYLKGYLNTLSIESRQCDLSIEVITTLFSKEYLSKIFNLGYAKLDYDDENTLRIYHIRDEYISTIDKVIAFLQGKLNTLAYQINDRNFLPEAGRFQQLDELDYSFGNLGIIDKAKHLCTLYLEDLGDFIIKYVDPHFGFNRYAERLAQTATSFDSLYEGLQKENGIINAIIGDRLNKHFENFSPDLVCITIPFIGNLYGALLSAKYIKAIHPSTKICIGGGYVNTELRRVYDERFFQYIDYISYDDGEAPLSLLLEHLQGKREINQLKRITALVNGVVQHINNTDVKDVAQRDTGTPDYSDLYLDKYLSLLEVTNPMHRLWSDGRWNKLTLAHGCYWGKCSFCDISLDYIARYEPINAEMLCDRMETIMEQTKENGFHFVDEAAPPALMGELALEIIKRKLQVTWWTNIRFEKSFTPELCKLLRASGCIAVTGGLEVASDRLLKMMEKGVTVEQVSQVCKAFTDSGIMVHAYLMYGFPTQTDQETIDSLEVVRQLFQEGVLKSGFWHRFAMTAHSPVGLYPDKYRVVHTGPIFEGFAENDYFHEDTEGANHDFYSDGLKTSLHNYMNGVGYDMTLNKWFDHKTPKTSHPKNLILSYINKYKPTYRSNAKVYFIGNLPQVLSEKKDSMELRFFLRHEDITIEVEPIEGRWLANTLEKLKLGQLSYVETTYQEFKKEYEEKTQFDFEEMKESDLWELLVRIGLIVW
jgi:hypothetical protein